MKLNPSHILKRIKKRKRLIQDQLLRESGWYDLTARSTLNAIFIGGCGRSGTTLFKEMLNRHSSCACGPETSLYGLPFDIQNIAAPWDMDPVELEDMFEQSSNLIEFADVFANQFLEAEQKSRWVEKTPNNVRAIHELLTWYPNGKFIHLVRDGRDVACSLRHHPKHRVVNGKIVPHICTNSMEFCATRWLEDTSKAHAFMSHPRCLEVRYEDLVNKPESVLRGVCEFIDEPYEDSMLDPSSAGTMRSGQNLNNENAAASVSSSSLGRWRTDMSADERVVFNQIAGQLLITLGYVQDQSWIHDSVEGLHES